jgi:hypothetical protein
MLSGLSCCEKSVLEPAPRFEIQLARQLDGAARSRRRAWRWVLVGEVLLLGLLAALAVVALGTAVLAAAGALAGAGRVLFVLASTTAAVAGGWYGVVRWLASRDLAAWAGRELGRGLQPDPGGADVLRSGLDIARQILQPSASPVGSPLLVGQALRQAAQRLDGLDQTRQRARQRLTNASLVLVVGGLAATWALRSSSEVWRQLVQPPTSTVPSVREVGTLVADLELATEPPPYARGVVKPERSDHGEGQVLRGGRATVTAQPLAPFSVTLVEFEVAPGRLETVALSPAGAAGVGWQRAVTASLRYRYRGFDADRQPVRERGFRVVTAQADQAPVASIQQPANEVEVRAGQTVAIEGEASDDIGLSAVDLVVARPATGVERRPIQVSAGATRAPVRQKIEVDALHLRPGEVAVVHLEAADTNPLDGNRHAESGKVRIRMFSPERFHAHNLDELAKLTELWTLRLADRLEHDPAALALTVGPALKNRTELADAEQRALEGLRNVRLQWAEDGLGQAKAQADLVEIERRLGEVLGDEVRALTRVDSTATGYAAVQGAYVIQQRHAAVVAEEEHAAWALGNLAAAEQGKALAREGKTLAEQERQLVATLEKLAEQGAEPLTAEAERLLDQVEQQLAQMAAQANKQMRLVPYEHINRGGLDAGGMHRDLGDHRGSLAEVRNLLKQGKAREALARMRELQADMQQAMTGWQGNVDRQRTAEDAALEKLVGDVRRAIGRAQTGEGRLRDDLRPAAEEQDQATQEQLRAARGVVVPAVLGLLQEARDALRPQKLATGRLRSHRGVADARSALQTAGAAVEQGQYDAALQSLLEAEDDLAGARRSLTTNDHDRPAEVTADEGRLAQAAERIGKAAAKLREALPAPDAVLKPATRQRVEAGTAAQEQIRRALQKLRERLAEAEAHPSLEREVGERLDHALQSMREAGDAMGRHDARRAFDQTAEVLDALERAASALDGSGQPQPGPSSPAESVGVAGGDQAVELRSGNQSDAVETFRQDVLRAMQQQQPGAWQDRLQKYWRAIAR